MTSEYTRANELDLAAAILDRAADMLSDPTIVGGPMLGAAQDCRALARANRQAARAARIAQRAIDAQSTTTKEERR